VAAQLHCPGEVEVELVKGGLGEFSVLIDGRTAVSTNRLWYPNPATVVERVRAQLAESSFNQLLTRS
jgi:hypothetical protein